MIQAQAEFMSASITIGGCRPPRCADPMNPTNASTRMEGGKCVFENNNYKITAGDNNEVLIQNKNTGETYKAWGDPHMEIDGKQAFDFWGTTTLNLDDGTKVTIETTPWANDPNATLSSKVTITNGGYGTQITGVDTNTTGDLKFNETHGWGRTLDAVVSDGNQLYENPVGKGFMAVDDFGRIRQVDQKYINETDLKKGGALTDQFKDAFRMLSGLLSITFAGAFLSSLARALEGNSGNSGNPGRNEAPARHHHHHHHHCPPDRMWPGGTPPWKFDETGGGRDGRPPIDNRFQATFEMTMVRFNVSA